MAMCNIGHTFYRKKAASMAMVSYAKTDDATKTNLKVVYPRCSVCFMTKKRQLEWCGVFPVWITEHSLALVKPLIFISKLADNTISKFQ